MMAERSEYRVRRFEFYMWILACAGGMIALTAVIPFIVLNSLTDKIVFSFFFCVWAAMTYVVIRRPYLVAFDDENESLVFKGLFSSKQMPLDQLESVIVNFNRIFVMFVFRGSKIVMPLPLKEFKDLIQKLKTVKSDIATVRC